VTYQKAKKFFQDSYIQQRSTAIESIETTIAELGQIFSQLANMVAEQRDTVQRIDADTYDIVANVEGGQRELLKVLARVSNSRWLMLKIFGVLIVFVSLVFISFPIDSDHCLLKVPAFYSRFVIGALDGTRYLWNTQLLSSFE
jgi:t-SNARE complex subunit (syntaxin)